MVKEVNGIKPTGLIDVIDFVVCLPLSHTNINRRLGNFAVLNTLFIIRAKLTYGARRSEPVSADVALRRLTLRRLLSV